MTQRRKIKATEVSFAILDYIERTSGATAEELAEQCGISRQGIYKHLRTLMDINAVRNENGVYLLGPKLAEYEVRPDGPDAFYKRYQVEIDGLADSLDASVNCWSKEGRRCVCKYQSVPNAERENPREIEESAVLVETIPGRTILAEYPDQNREAFINAEAATPDQVEIRRQLRKASERNLLTETLEGRADWVSIASSFCDDSGEPVGAIEVVMPSERARGLDIEVNIVGSLLDTVKNIEIDAIDQAGQ